MRLLQRDNANNYTLTADLRADNTPPYAILSHTSGADEVVYTDIKARPSEWQQKVGYCKIQFCADQAKRHDLQHFWVDTCCIDKSDGIELQTAINSMFRWYRDAKRCYDYLSIQPPGVGSWEAAFRGSRWFTRGWTLQELIAPQIVEFYSREGVFLGDKRSLEAVIRDVTGIPARALRNTPLSYFTTSEREAWIRNRETTCEEDMAYSLLGIFDLYMPLLYGEGRERAQRRLRQKVQKSVKGRTPLSHRGCTLANNLGTYDNNFLISFNLSGVPETPHFVARDGEVAEMRRMLCSDGSRCTVILHGLGGIGKTQLAATYLKRYRDEYSAIFWLNIKDEASIQQSFARIATQILEQNPDVGSLKGLNMLQDHDKIIQAVKAWLSLPGNTRWLIVSDNYDNPKLPGRVTDTAVDIHQFLPMAYQGSIIVTTRLSQVDIGHQIRIEKLKSDCESLQILSRASGRNGLQDDGDAKELVRELDGLPLALATAAAYLKRVPISFRDYLRHYRESWARLTGNLHLDHTLCSTWQLSYEHNPLAAHLLRWWAYFNNEDICEDGPAWMGQLSEELNFNDAVGVLHEYGLVEPTTMFQEPQGYSIHSCLHSWTIHILNEEWDSCLNKVAVESVASQVPSREEAEYWLPQKRLISHAIRSCSTVQESNCPTDRAFHSLGYLYTDQGKLGEAEKMYLQALNGYERAVGLEDVTTYRPAINTLENLGSLLSDQGHLIQARQYYQRGYDGLEQLLGPSHQAVESARHILQLTKSAIEDGMCSSGGQYVTDPAQPGPAKKRRRDVL
ncbi:kinesin light chain 1 [Microdochium trichocladiopsis]|uniref:Kinesin light chain 1 n=1 Tax=Microdochium trichocladiopsis TaxID=1682393 RepID=A0A9P9BPT4_9PEZI|nr:kinesin light chain 1 [Microdochium trichocladiopsis]KAH7029604.1 kinesin light chain 1 [Microdochium trichocladiopsis]